MTGSMAELRRLDIIARVRRGETLGAVGRSHGLTRQRVAQILGASVRTLRAPRGRAARPRIDRSARGVRRFWSRFQVDEAGCWLWTGPRYPTGYGQIAGGYAHRRAFELVNGPIPAGLQLDHLCRKQACGNPAHLEAVTPRENVRRGLNGVLRPNPDCCRNGHPLTDRTPSGRCRQCLSASNRRAYLRRAGQAA